MIQRRSVLLTVAITVLVMMSTTVAFAMRGKIDNAAGIAFSSSYPEHARKQVQAALQNKGCKSIDGSFINAVSTLNFGGDTPSINELLEELAECPGTRLAVSFKKIEHECDWRLIHDAHTNRFHITVNLKSKQVNIEELVIPSAQGPDLP
jgi:broad specificity polyphosphatase/5'/3'-nucleotidase SurE